jgi:uncharacterized protein YkwD
MLRLTLGSLLFVGACSLLGAAGCSSSLSETGVSQANPLDSEEQDLIGTINGIREGAGAPDLVACASLDTAASAHADDMRDNDYLDDTSLDGKSTRDRDCAAGYMPACDTSSTISELVAAGNDQGASTAMQWQTDPDPSIQQILVDPIYVVIGAGRSIGDEKTYWAADLGSATDDTSCAGAQ